VDTEEELAGALAALQRRSPEELSAFIVSLVCGAPSGALGFHGIKGPPKRIVWTARRAAFGPALSPFGRPRLADPRRRGKLALGSPVHMAFHRTN